MDKTVVMNLQKYEMEFLWYSYFGMPMVSNDANDEQKEEALICCIHRAYRDANRWMPFTLSESKIKGSNDSERVKAFIALKKKFSPAAAKGEPDSVKLILKHIRTLLSDSNEGYSKLAFDNWHKGACTCLKNFAEDLMENNVSLFRDSFFPYGFTQKWINMTLKYMLIMGLWNDELSEKVRYFHVPIDAYIINEAKESFKDELSGYWQDTKWYESDDYDEYLCLQNLIRRRVLPLTPIEWEADAWIKQGNALKGDLTTTDD